MATVGIELCDVALQAASCQGVEIQSLAVSDAQGITDWPGFAYFDGAKYSFGRLAEDQWFVHPRHVVHTFWSRLAHEPSTIGPPGRLAPLSELAFHHFRQFVQRLAEGTPAARTVLAVPGSYLKDPATEEEKIGLLLGIAGELKLPLAGIVDMACAALCDSRASGFNPALPVVVVDLHLGGAELTLVGTEERVQRLDFIYLPQSGYAQLLKHLTGTLGNRLLRLTAFDILEDGRIEQSFFRQTKEFILGGAAEHRFQINTSTRSYEMIAKREQLATDSLPFVTSLVQGLQGFLKNSPFASEPCTIALTHRAAGLPGLEARLHAVGLHRILRLPPGAAAGGAARLGEYRQTVPGDLADVPVEIALPLAVARRSSAASWETHLQRLRTSDRSRPTPTHVVLDGIGYALGDSVHFTIGVAGLGADVALPDTFSSSDDCALPLVREGGRLWFTEKSPPRTSASGNVAPAPRVAIEAGDRVTIRCGSASAEVLFVHCRPVGAKPTAG